VNVTIAAVLAGVLASAGAAGTGIALQSHPAALTPSQKTCAAFWKWDHARTGANLNVMMTDSETAPWQHLGIDVGVVYFDARGHNRTDLPGDVAGVASDCR
jgi:hypothetical protein